jgi:hypothetical protein
MTIIQKLMLADKGVTSMIVLWHEHLVSDVGDMDYVTWKSLVLWFRENSY